MDALVLEGRSGEHRHQLQRDRRAADRGAELFRGQIVLFEPFAEHRVVVFGDVLDHLLAVLPVEGFGDSTGADGGGHVGPTAEKGRIPELLDGENVVLSAQGVVAPDDDALVDEIDDTDEGIFFAEGELEGNRVGGQALTHRADTVVEVGADAVHLVHEGDARDAILIGLAPDGFRLGLDSGDRIEDGHCTIQNPERTLHLDGEVHMARGIDDVDAVFFAESFPEGGGGRGSDGDAPLALLLHPVHRGGAFVHFTELVGHAGVEKDALGRSGLPGIDVRHDADVAQVRQWNQAWHRKTVSRCGYHR